MLTRVVRNLKTLATNPSVARDYFLYWESRLLNRGRAIRTFPGGIKIAGFCNFSEFHSVGDFVSDEEREFLSNYSIPEGAIVDVGANVGIVSLMLAKRFPGRSIHSFEPAPSTFATFEANIGLNGCANVRALRCAVSDLDGEILFNADPMGRATSSIALSAGDKAVRVPCTTLDTYAKRNSIDEIAFLKVDVEGFEASVFQGARDILSQHRAAIVYYEVCPGNSRNSGIDPELPTRILLENGYQIRRVSSEGALEPARVSDVSQTVLDNWVGIRP